uniref:ANK_REP_REGION domain-containing protein n=1 Tax=Syphacia muris TaxID=451379 RepID=A0A0N5AZ99_9BILA
MDEELILSTVLIACEEGNLADLNKLLTIYRFNLNVANRVRYLYFQAFFQLGETAIHVSAGAGQSEVVRYLHLKGASLETVDRRGDTPLFWAARNGHVHVLRYLLQEKHDLGYVNFLNKSKESALHVATRYAQLDAAIMLLEYGADASLEDEQGETALHVASWHGYGKLLAALCQYDPNFDAKNQAIFLLATDLAEF